MIYLLKSAIPTVLQTNAAAWTSALLIEIAAGGEAKKARQAKYNRSEIKEALIKETSGKCAYCESKFGHVTYGDIEHVIPKSVAPEITFEWSNLTIACDKCNTNKSDEEGLVDPYEEEPANHLIFDGPMVLAHPDSIKGRLTEEVLDLNRSELIERRRDRLKDLMRRLNEIKTAPTDDLRRVLRRKLLEVETSGSTEYAAISRRFVQMLKEKGLLPDN